MLWNVENEFVAKGYKTICGVDEAGRGPLAGPVVAAAVILPHGVDIPGLNDSKKLSPKKREELYDVITKLAIAYGVASASHTQIDEVNILQATFFAMNRAIEMLEITPDIAIIDGNRNSGILHPSECVVGGDAKSPSIAAASVLAKVTRDRHMIEMAERYPEYVFEKHKGYGTKLHYERLAEFGMCEIHRRSFLKESRNGKQQ